jgi:tripartite-type tricarboxylate transporter receptor subunit TctC
MSHLNFVSRLTALCLALVVSGSALAQAYPTKPIKLVVGFAAGGSTDVIARVLAQRMSATLGQPIVVDNRPGAGSQVGSAFVSKSEPDGYTLLLGTVGLTVQTGLYGSKMPLDVINGFTHITLVAETPNALVVGTAVPVNSVAELTTWLRSNPSKASFASSGVGTGLHLSGELFKMRQGLDMPHVPYRGSGPALNDLMGGQVPMMFDNLTTALPLIQGGKLKALAVTSAKRSPSLPNVPTMGEAGVKDFDTSAWYGLMAPPGLPEAIAKTLLTHAHQALESEEMVKALAALGTTALKNTPAEFKAFVKADAERWTQVVQKANIKAE